MTSLGTVSTSVASALFELSQTLTTASADFSVAQSNVLDQAKTGLQTSIEAAASKCGQWLPLPQEKFRTRPTLLFPHRTGAYVDPLDSTETKLRSVIDGAKAAAIDAAKTVGQPMKGLI